MEESIQNNITCEQVNSKEKQDYAQDILVEANTLLLCSNYNSKSSDCSICHTVSRKYLQEYGHFPKVK